MKREFMLYLRNAGDAKAASAVDPGKQLQVKYYHIGANDIEETVDLAKENSEFEYVPSADNEVRPVKMKEEQTNFMYPG